MTRRLPNWNNGGLPPPGHLAYLAESLWLSGMTDAEVARRLGKSRERVGQLWRRWVRAIAHHAPRSPVPPMEGA